MPRPCSGTDVQSNQRCCSWVLFSILELLAAAAAADTRLQARVQVGAVCGWQSTPILMSWWTKLPQVLAGRVQTLSALGKIMCVKSFECKIQ